MFKCFVLSSRIACRMVGAVPLLVVVVSSTSGEKACHRKRGQQ